ncbi:MAG TPA: SPFH domain-containing protein [Armatimonadota bacterium]|nr:SPFH domain-containing protein [Armatimonadota bacterium]
MNPASLSLAGYIILALAIIVLPSIRIIGPTEIGLVMKRFGFRKLSEDNPIAFNGEAGFQADLLMPGFRFKLWIIYKVGKFPWVEVPAGEIGVVVAQAGRPLPIGAKSAVYNEAFGNFNDLRSFVENGGQKGVQRPVLPPGSLLPIHPVGFLVITKRQVYGVPVSPELQNVQGVLGPANFGLAPERLELVRIQPVTVGPENEIVDMVGIVTTYEGEPLPEGAIASRLGGFTDVAAREKEDVQDSTLIEAVLGSKNDLHNNYQDLQAFLDHGGRIGLQHDPLLYGAFALNPFLVSVELVPMLVVEQGQVAVMKAYVGLATEDTSGPDFKFGSLVRPGHRGIWQEPLRTGKYPINPRCYQAEIVPTLILTLNWAEVISSAHRLDARLASIEAKSREGFIFTLDLQVQIHVPDTKAPKVISSVGTMQNLVDEVLQAVVGNYFRNKLQSMPAVDFIQSRDRVQQDACELISQQIAQYQVETKGVFIQDVVLPPTLVEVLTQREIANQQIETLQKQRASQQERISMEQAKGTADMQSELAKSAVNVDIFTNKANARKAEADGEATFIRETGKAKGAEVEAVGLARAKAYEEQVKALGQTPTALVNSINALAEKGIKIVPEILVAGGGGGSGAIEGLAASLMGYLGSPRQKGAMSQPGGDGPRGRQRAAARQVVKKESEAMEPVPLPEPPPEETKS